MSIMDRVVTTWLIDGKYRLDLTGRQMELIEARKARAFWVRCSKEYLLQKIDECADYRQLQDIAKKFYLCDYCDLSDLNLSGTKRMLKVIVHCMYKYPRLRGSLAFIGSRNNYRKIMGEIKNGNVEHLKKFNLQFICNDDMSRIIGGEMYSSIVAESANDCTWAMAYHGYGLFGGVIFDSLDFGGRAYARTLKEIRDSERSGFHPKGCVDLESVMYHELGHIIDFMTGLRSSPRFLAYYNTLTNAQIKRELSEYAATSVGETIAEAFAEGCCNKMPRPIAKRINNILDEVYAAQK